MSLYDCDQANKKEVKGRPMVFFVWKFTHPKSPTYVRRCWSAFGQNVTWHVDKVEFSLKFRSRCDALQWAKDKRVCDQWYKHHTVEEINTVETYNHHEIRPA